MPLPQCIKGTSSSRRKKDSADTQPLWGILSKSRQTEIDIYSIHQRADNLKIINYCFALPPLYYPFLALLADLSLILETLFDPIAPLQAGDFDIALFNLRSLFVCDPQSSTNDFITD